MCSRENVHLLNTWVWFHWIHRKWRNMQQLPLRLWPMPFKSRLETMRPNRVQSNISPRKGHLKKKKKKKPTFHLQTTGNVPNLKWLTQGMIDTSFVPWIDNSYKITTCQSPGGGEALPLSNCRQFIKESRFSIRRRSSHFSQLLKMLHVRKSVLDRDDSRAYRNRQRTWSCQSICL